VTGFVFGIAFFTGVVCGLVGLFGGALLRLGPPGLAGMSLGRFGRRDARAEGRPARRRRRWPWIVLGLLVGVPLLLSFLAGVYNGREVDARLARAIAAADRDDPDWRFDDLLAARRSVPDEENAALVVARAVALLPPNWPAVTFVAPGEPAPRPAPAQHAFDALMDTPANVWLEDGMSNILRDELREHEAAVLIARAVADYDIGRHEIEPLPNPYDILLTQTQATRSVARLLACDAAIRAQDGDPDAALDSCRAALAVARSIGDEPFSISQLVRSAVAAVALDAACRALAQCEASDAALERLQTLVLDERSRPLLAVALEGERASLFEFTRGLRDGVLPFSDLRSINAHDLAIPTLTADSYGLGSMRTGIAPWGRLLFDHQLAVGLDWMNDAVAHSRRPSHEWVPLFRGWAAEVNRTRATRYGPYTTPIPMLVAAGVPVIPIAQLRYQAHLGATALLLAAERHRLKTGAWPGSIEAIDASILPVAPLDPDTGEPFRMDVGDGLIRVYSLGANLRDEQGAWDPKRAAALQTDDDVGVVGFDVSLRGLPEPR
jgi:hypothetical protein